MGRAIWSIEIEASPEKVFAFFISDNSVDIWKECAEMKWTSAGPVGVGSTAHYVGVHKRNKGEEWNAEITEFTKNKSMTMFLKGANKHSNDQTNYFAFEPTTKGTKFTMTWDYKEPYSVLGKLIGGLIRSEVEKIGNSVMENLKNALKA